jgi:pimeloyl-ACP methyl ester carboxylesterase
MMTLEQTMEMTAGVLRHNGCDLSYTVRGAGEPVVFIQGVGVHGSGWGPQVEALSDKYCCLAFDNRGIGKSQPVGRELSITQMAEDVLALMNQQGWESAHLVGHSMGGPIALQVALTARHRVRSLALLCTFGRGKDVTRPSGRMMWLGIRSRIGTKSMRRRAFLEMVMPKAQLASQDPDLLALALAQIFGHDLADQPPIAMKQLSAMSKFDATRELEWLEGIPTLVVSADEDPIAPPPLGRALAAGIPAAQYVEVPGASHGVTISHAELINDLLAQHLSGPS